MKKLAWHLLFFQIFFFIDVQVSYGAERFEYYNGVRQMAMGGASIGVANDETSLFANPNGLGKIRSSILTVLDPEGDATGNYASFVLDGGNPFDYFDLDGLLEAANKNPDEDIYSKLQVFPSMVFTNFGFGLHKKLNYSLVPDDSGTNADIRFFDDTALLLGFNFRLFGGRLKLGFTGKYLNRASAEETLPLSTTNADIENYIKEGVAIGADLGLTLSAPWTWLPSLSAVVRDVGNTSFTTSGAMFYDATEKPDTIKQTYDVAFSVFPIHSNNTRSSLTFELRDVENILDEEDMQRRSHIGWELNVSDALFIRAGMNQRYWTAGLELATKNSQFQLASYGEDIGPDEDPKESRRFVFKFAYRY